MYYIGKSNDVHIGNFILSSKLSDDKVENNIMYYKGMIKDAEDAIKNIDKFKVIVPLKGEDLINRMNGE